MPDRLADDVGGDLDVSAAATRIGSGSQWEISRRFLHHCEVTDTVDQPETRLTIAVRM